MLSKIKPDETSDILTYWRHEFHTYLWARLLAGSHRVDANGYHPDGTYHVDHGRLVIAIQGGEREPGKTATKPLQKGKKEIDLVLTVAPGARPLPSATVSTRMSRAVADSVRLRERAFVERQLVRVGP